MRFVAVTACPTGVAHTYMAAEALRHQSVVAGHEIAIETQGSAGVGDELSPEAVEAADAVIIAADIHVDPARFAGKPLVVVSTADAIRRTSAVIDEAVTSAGGDAGTEGTVADGTVADGAAPDSAAATEGTGPGAGVPTDSPSAAVAPPAPGTSAAPAAEAGPRRFVAITSCPTGIAHTFMAAEGLRRGAEALGHEIKVETQGSVGSQDVLTADDVAAADAVVIAADTKVDLARFAGKPIYETSTNDALKNGEGVLVRALEAAAAAPDGGRSVAAAGGGAAGGGSPGGGGGGAGDGDASGGRAALKGIYQHLMTGVSYMLPFVVAGGLLIAISFAFDIDANDPALAETFAGRLNQVGSAALTLFLPVFAGFIAFSIADRPGLTPGFVGGYLAVEVEAGFLGALLAGFVAGYVTLWLARHINLPDTLAGLKPVLILPLLSTLVIGLVMIYVLGEPLAWLQDELTEWLEGLQGSNAVVLGLILGAMMATDMGGPLNKVAYTFAVGLIDSGVTAPMAAVMAAGMTPPLGLAVATVLFPGRWTKDEHEAGKPAFVLGLSFITEGAIPFAARDPVHVIPALVVGSATAGAISLGLDAATVVPHGGIFDLFVPGAVDNALAWLLAIVVGTLVTTAVLFVTKRPLAGAATADEPVTAVAAA
jgi:PTS system fructose-specific IIC component